MAPRGRPEPMVLSKAWRSEEAFAGTCRGFLGGGEPVGLLAAGHGVAGHGPAAPADRRQVPEVGSPGPDPEQGWIFAQWNQWIGSGCKVGGGLLLRSLCATCCRRARASTRSRPSARTWTRTCKSSTLRSRRPRCWRSTTTRRRRRSWSDGMSPRVPGVARGNPRSSGGGPFSLRAASWSGPRLPAAHSKPARTGRSLDE